MKPSPKIIKILKISGISLLVFLGILIALPYFLKPKIIQAIKTTANESMNATMDFTDIDVSLLRSFPQLYLSITDLSIVGKDTFQDIPLIKAKEIGFDLSVKELWADQFNPKIYYLYARDFDLNILVLDSLHANYLIALPDTTAADQAETAPFTLALEKYDIQNGNIIYEDRTMPIELRVQGLSHTGKGNFTLDIFDLQTTSKAEALSVKFAGVQYLSNAKVQLDATLNMDIPNMKFTFKDNEAVLNAFPFYADGFVQLLEDDMGMDLRFGSPSSDFKSILSVVPKAFTEDFDQVKASGEAAFNATVKGTLSEARNLIPAFDFNIEVKNGAVQYPGMPVKLSGFNTKTQIAGSKADLSDLMVDIPTFEFLLDQEKLSGKLKISNGVDNPKIAGFLKGGLDLEKWTRFFPMQEIEKLKGLIKSDLSFDANLLDVQNEVFEKIKFEGNLGMRSFLIKLKDYPAISMEEAKGNASPKKFAVEVANAKLGKSDFDASFSMENPLALLSPNKSVQAQLNFDADLLDLNEWMPATASPAPTSEEANFPMELTEADIQTIQNSSIRTQTRIGRLVYGQHDIKDFVVTGKVKGDAIDMQDFRMKINESDIQANGTVTNILSFITQKDVVRGNLNFSSQNFDANAFMVASDATNTVSEENLKFDVPAGIDFTMTGDIKTLKYTNMTLKNCVGTFIIKDESIALQDVSSEVLGGRIGFEGLYDTKEEKPNFGMRLDLAKLSFSEAFNTFNTFQQLAPIAQYIQGLFNTTLVLQGQLGDNMIPDLSSLSASGFIETLNGSIKNLNIFQEVGSKLGLKQLETLDLTNTKNWFEVVNGVVELKPLSRNIAGIDLSIGGKHHLGKEMDFEMMLKIPRELLQKNQITANVERGLGMLEREASRLGVNIAQGEFIDLKVNIGGLLASPKLKIAPVGTSGQSVKNQVKEQIDLKKEALKDTLTTVAKAKEREIRDTLNARLDAEKERVKSQVTEKVNTIADQAKNELEKKANEIIPPAKQDSIKNKANEVLQNTTGQSIQDINERIKKFNPFKKKGG